MVVLPKKAAVSPADEGKMRSQPKLVHGKLKIKHVVPAGIQHPSATSLVHGLIQSALNCVQLNC